MKEGLSWLSPAKHHELKKILLKLVKACKIEHNAEAEIQGDMNQCSNILGGLIHNTSNCRLLFNLNNYSDDKEFLKATKPDISRTAYPVLKDKLPTIGQVSLATVIELKATNINLADASTIGQIYCYLVAILRSQPQRSFAIGALFNGHSLLLCRMVRTSHEINYNDANTKMPFTSKFCLIERNQQIISTLVTLMVGDLSELGWIPLKIPDQELILQDYLGCGASSFVFRAGEYAVKIRRNPGLPLNFGSEVPIVKQLRRDPDPMFRDMLQEFMDIPAKIALVSKPLGIKFDLKNTLHLSMIPKIIALLQQIHNKGIIHLNAILENILINGDKPLLIDFKYAYATTLTTNTQLETTDSLLYFDLETLTRLKNNDFSCSEKLDFVILMRSMFLALNDQYSESIQKATQDSGSSEKIVAVFELWSQIQDDNVWRPWKELSAKIQSGDYDEFGRGLNSLLMRIQRMA